MYAVGEDVDNVKVGDEVVIHHGWWERDDPWVDAGKDPMIAPSAHIWGYDAQLRRLRAVHASPRATSACRRPTT